jgi:hypothetical protein
MSWRGTSGHDKARWTGYRTDRRAGRSAARPCPRLGCILPYQNTRETSGQCQGTGVWCRAPVKAGEPSCVTVSDDEAHTGVRATHGTSSAWWPGQACNRILSTPHGGDESPSLPHGPFLLRGLTGRLRGASKRAQRRFRSVPLEAMVRQSNRGPFLFLAGRRHLISAAMDLWLQGNRSPRAAGRSSRGQDWRFPPHGAQPEGP